MPTVPPPVPPLPTGIRVQSDFEYRPSPPHLEEPLLAPRPHKVTPDLPAEVGTITSCQMGAVYIPNLRKRALVALSFGPDGANP